MTIGVNRIGTTKIDFEFKIYDNHTVRFSLRATL
jgi:hypothetical protein